jgi:hypothetical protein
LTIDGQAPPDVTADRIELYRHLTERFGKPTVLALIDKLQVLALTQPDTLREMEEFLDRRPRESGKERPNRDETVSAR